MRVLILISAVFLLANIVLYLLPTDIETSNLSYASDPEINQSDILFIEKEKPINPIVLSASSGSGFESPNAGQSVNNACFRIGPFLRETRVNIAGKRLEDLSVEYELIERQSTKVTASRVYVGPFEGASEAVVAREKLTESGINDHFHRREPDGTYIVSLGIYSKSDSAEIQQIKFREKNIAARVREEKTQLPKNYWIELPKSVSQSSIESLAGVDWGESSVSAGMHKCKPNA